MHILLFNLWDVIEYSQIYPRLTEGKKRNDEIKFEPKKL